jgi:hypothetical protein
VGERQHSAPDLYFAFEVEDAGAFKGDAIAEQPACQLAAAPRRLKRS